jgi:NTP pyrophosphatase (non-canonical NTP hydrolase)
MNWSEYLELSEKTLSEEFHIGAKTQNILHAVMGLATEIEELLDNYAHEDAMDSTNMLEEIGDLTWYVAIIHREYPDMLRYENAKVTVTNRDNPFDCVLDLNKSILKLMDMMKKKIFYNKPIPMVAFSNLTLLVETDIHWLAEYYNIKVEDICETNINKLKARYGDKFTSERAINRDLDTEREILESGDESLS